MRGEPATVGDDAIVVTGLGTVNALGASVDAFDEPRSVPVRVGSDRSSASTRPATGAGSPPRCATSRCPRWIPSPLRRRASRSDLFALVAAAEALAGSGLDVAAAPDARRHRPRCDDRRDDVRGDELPRPPGRHAPALSKERLSRHADGDERRRARRGLRLRWAATRAQHRMLVERHRVRDRARLDPSRSRRRGRRGRHRIDVPDDLRRLQRAARALARAVPAVRPSARGSEPRRGRGDPRARARLVRRAPRRARARRRARLRHERRRAPPHGAAPRRPRRGARDAARAGPRGRGSGRRRTTSTRTAPARRSTTASRPRRSPRSSAPRRHGSR